MNRSRLLIAAIIVSTLCFSAIAIYFVSITTPDYGFSDITVNSVSYYLHDQDLVLSVVVSSNTSLPAVDFTLKSGDDRVSIDGSPVLNWKIDTLTVQLVNEQPSSLEFKLSINGSSVIPARYMLSASYGDKKETAVIKPFTSPESITSDLSIDVADIEIITSPVFKGQPFITRTLVLNWYGEEVGPVDLNFNISTSTYSGINGMSVFNGSGYSTAESLSHYSSRLGIPTAKIIDVLVPWHGYDGKKHFALNRGEWIIDHVTANAPGITSTNTFDEEFTVTLQSGTHPVLVAHLVDQDFRDKFDEESFFDALEKANFSLYTVDGPNTTLSEHFGINFESLVLDWSPTTTDSLELFHSLDVDAKPVLGLTHFWSGKKGTHPDNHGFDLLFGHSYSFSSGSQAGGYAYQPGNMGVVMRGYMIGGVLPRQMDQILTTIHEILHSYNCYTSGVPHVPNTTGYIMSEILSGYIMHPDTESTLFMNVNQYDGA